jgi:hypothetical protein
VLRYNITDRKCLNELDKRIAQEVLHALTGTHSPKGFRQYPIKKMRAHGLPSLVALRNQEE